MKRIAITLVIIVTYFQLSAQKIGHFSSGYVMQQMSSYQEAQERINQLSLTWMDEVKAKYVEIGRLESKLEAEKILLTKEMIKDREAEIETLLKEAIDYQYKVFGPEGLFFLRKKELIQPELETIFEAVERVCKKQGLDYLIDKSDQLVLIYTNPVHDYTDYVLEELGLDDSNDFD